MHLSTSDAFEIFTNEYHNQTGDNMKKFELFMEVKIRVEDQKGRCVPEVLSYQVYEGDDLDRKYSGYSKTQSLDGKTIVVTYPVKVTKKRNKAYSKLNELYHLFPEIKGDEGNFSSEEIS
jgi:hypothetical protein